MLRAAQLEVTIGITFVFLIYNHLTIKTNAITAPLPAWVTQNLEVVIKKMPDDSDLVEGVKLN